MTENGYSELEWMKPTSYKPETSSPYILGNVFLLKFVLVISRSAELEGKNFLWTSGTRGTAKLLLADGWNHEAITMFQRFHGEPEEDEGVDQGVDAVTPENLRENKPRESGAAHNPWPLRKLTDASLWRMPAGCCVAPGSSALFPKLKQNETKRFPRFYTRMTGLSPDTVI